MNNEDDELHRPSTSSGELSDQNASECPKESSRLNNNVVNGYNGSECCADCDTAAQHDHIIAASLVHCDQDENDSDDDCCIYTYRGDRQEPKVENVPLEDRNTSPLMDYLEMDFDPEPTVGNESEDEDTVPDITNHQNESLVNTDEPTPSSSINDNNPEDQNTTTIIGINGLIKPITLLPVTNLLSTQNNSSNSSREERNGCVRRNSDAMDVCQKMKRMRVDDLSWVKEMVWSESEASKLQINQIGVSASGATSVVNTLLALRISFSIDHIAQTIGTCLLDETAPLIPYLESRAAVGCMPQDLVRTLETVTDSLVSARFFPTHHNLDITIAPWLASWIKKGAVPILTLNRQRQALTNVSPAPDSWNHHQMMYGIAYNPLRPECAQIYLTNPLSQLSMEILQPQLFAPSALLIRRADVLSRWTPYTDLLPLATHPSRHWHRINVLGQVVNLLREEHEGIQFTQHIVIPANYKSGITLAMRTSSNYSHELKSVPEL